MPCLAQARAGAGEVNTGHSHALEELTLVGLPDLL